MTTGASSLHTFLKDNNKRPSKKLSQNFLVDPNIVQKLLDVANIQEGDTVLEIGPGTGAITQQLLNRGAQVFAVEKDYHLAHALQKLIGSEKCAIIQGDIINIDLSTLLPKNKKVKVISNLPFQITSLIFDKLLPLDEHFNELTLILQKDVLDRLLAKPDSKAYSSLTLFTECYAKVMHCFDIPSSCYYPQPAVETSVAQFTLEKIKHTNIQKLIQFIRLAFAKRRKMLSSTIPLPALQVQETLKKLKLNAFARPENLNLKNWIQLFETLEADLSI